MLTLANIKMLTLASELPWPIQNLKLVKKFLTKKRQKNVSSKISLCCMYLSCCRDWKFCYV